MKVVLWACRDKDGDVNLSKQEPARTTMGWWDAEDSTYTVHHVFGLLNLRKDRKKQIIVTIEDV